MIYHRFRFGFRKNLKVLLCRMVGHRLNEDPKLLSCERCGLAYEEAYYPLDYYVGCGLVKVDKQKDPIYANIQRIKEVEFKRNPPKRTFGENYNIFRKT